MNKNTLIGLILLVGLFIWSMSLSTNRAKEAQAVAAQKAKTEQSENQRSGALRTPELSLLDSANLVPATLAPAAKTPEVAADSVKDSSVALAPIARQKIKVETEHFTAVFDNRGAKITSVVVKALKDSAGNYPEIIADTTLGALALKVDGVDLSEQMFSVPENTPDFIRVERDTALSFTFQDPNGNKIIRHFAFTPKGVSIQQKIFFEGFKPNDYELLWLGGMKETEEFPKGKALAVAAISLAKSSLTIWSAWNGKRSATAKNSMPKREKCFGRECVANMLLPSLNSPKLRKRPFWRNTLRREVQIARIRARTN